MSIEKRDNAIVIIYLCLVGLLCITIIEYCILYLDLENSAYDMFLILKRMALLIVLIFTAYKTGLVFRVINTIIIVICATKLIIYYTFTDYRNVDAVQ